ncbi:GNAT family N-acetyltransferase [Streptomyces sp. NPDC021356]|uniref:GNAT family N-acetyltransferase n=1 Tax=Streptomyces sp. NPDC021356 TaxID=3154900 RepID=UPI0033D9BBD6
MACDDWYLTPDLDEFLARAGEFLRSRPAQHTVHLTVTENLRARGGRTYGDGAPEFGVLEGEPEGAGARGVRASFFRTPPHPLVLTPLTEAEADALAALLAGRERERDGAGGLTGVNADHDTAAAFAAAWHRHTGARTTVRRRLRLYRLGGLTVPRPVPPGRARVAGTADRELLARWYTDFCAAVGETAVRDPRDWADEHARSGAVTFWQTPDGAPVAMAGTSPVVAGQVRINAVYTPARLRGRGYAGAVTAEVSRVAVASGAAEVLLFTDLANPTSNGLYQRIGYRPVSDFAVHGFEAGDASG